MAVAWMFYRKLSARGCRESAVIVMTAFPLEHLRREYPSQTLAAWLTKPVNPQQLLDAVQAALGKGRHTDNPCSAGG